MDTDTVIESLAAKLAAADLDDAEIDLLRTLIAEPDDVGGFTIKPIVGAEDLMEIIRSSATAKGWWEGGPTPVRDTVPIF